MSRLAEHPTLLVHCHMPKTAGSALNRQVILPMHDRAAVLLAYGVEHEQEPHLDSTAVPAPLSYLSGHVPFGFAARLGRPLLHVSVLREPVERMISFFNFVAVADRHGARKGFDRDMQELARSDPADFVRLLLKRRRVMNRQSNIMTRLAAGIPRLAKTVPDRSALEAALSNARSGTYLLGMQDRFDAFACELKDELLTRGIGTAGANDDLATSARLEKRFERVIRQEDLPEAIIRTIRKTNDLDLRLCDFVRDNAKQVRWAA
jgi:hypothetical protein